MSQGKLRASRPLTEKATEAIRRMIVRGDFLLGEALSEITLANRLGVSKTPVREALLQLKLEGLVEIMPRRGSFVFQMNVAQVTQLSHMRRILEDAGLVTAMADNWKRLGEDLAQISAKMGDAIKADDAERYVAFDEQFHHAIVNRARNEYLADAYSHISFRIQALRNRLSRDPSINLRSLGEHGELAVLVAARDVDAARVLLNRHIRMTEQQYIAELTAGGERLDAETATTSRKTLATTR